MNPTNGTKQGQKAWGRSERLADGMGHESAHKWLMLCEPDKNPTHRETTKGPNGPSAPPDGKGDIERT